ncbi:hypothetical protein [Stenotrophomonas sp. CFBP 13725]|uniref:hypothetical protein n=2 Tax=unclassified Stenotrophomonas TaxID=196198 RepID=UPI00177D1C57|nr:hypothetical protein [Stenotrophomonas sp. CFBP 13725]MBD8636629.1 hypothetical protein [Stenotrophomonas sp. CFBP 13725]
MLPLPELMATKKNPVKNAMRKKAPVRKNLAAAAKVVHSKPEREYAPLIDLGQFSEEELAELMVAAGDAPARKTYFDYSEEAPYTRSGQRIYLEVGRDSTMFDYRDENGTRVERTMVTVPPKLREQLQEITGEEQPIVTTSIIALASWACQELKKTKRRLVVTTATDDLDPVRKQVRKAIVAKSRKTR